LGSKNAVGILMSPFDKRRDYGTGELLEQNAAADPFTQFRQWFDIADEHPDIVEAGAMTLATATAAGIPSARVVLLRQVDEGFVFFSNYESRKGGELETNPHAAIVFHWAPLEQQVRIEGEVSRVSTKESDTYFASRPYRSRLGALISKQSTVINDAEQLRSQLTELERHYPEGSTVPRPPNWGGYRVTPHSVEFWQGRRSRLHDRLRYRKDAAEWILERLAP
jgi:pyridoxamine 5'-phosphate oxidase